MTDISQFETIQRLQAAASPDERLPEAVEALAAAVERGHHMAIVAGEGARLCRLYTAAAIGDLGEGDRARGIVLVSTPERGRRLARSIERFGASLGWETVLWSADRATSGVRVSDRAVIVATPARLLADMRAGDTQLDEVRLLVLDDVAALQDEWSAVDALLQAVDEDVRRIAATHRRDAEFDRLVERLLPRARKWPQELLEADTGERRKLTGPPLRYMTAPSHDARLRRLVDLLHGWAADPELQGVTVWCDDATATAGIQAALAIEGFSATTDADEEGVRIRKLTNLEDGIPDGPGVIFGLPWSASDLTGALGPARLRAAVVQPRHAAQLELLAERAGWPARPLPGVARAHISELDTFRSAVETAIGERDLASATLLIEPLIEEHGYERVSAALASLLRSDVKYDPADASSAADTQAGGGAERPGSGAPGASVDAQRATRSTWSKVFVNVGRQDGAAPGDFVGAITGETSAAGGQIGKIEIRQKFALIDIDSMVVDEVVKSLNGKQIKGRDVVARLDRDG